MKAVIVRQYGEPEVLKYEDAADPSPKDGEVLVRVAATSVNPFDIKRRSGAAKDQAPIDFPGSIGVDVAGVVEAVGNEVLAFSVGDRVFAMADKTYAQFCVVPAKSLARIPDSIDLIDAAALPLVLTTGHTLVSQVGKVEFGQTVLVTGAAGNVGRSAVYAAKQRGVRVIAGVLTNQLSDAAVIGADETVATDDFAAMGKLAELDAVADTVGGKIAELLLAKVKPGGVFATVLDSPANAKDYPRVKVVSVFTTPNAEALLYMVKAVQEGKLVLPIAKRMPMAGAAEAHDAMAKGTVHGKILLVNESIAG